MSIYFEKIKNMLKNAGLEDDEFEIASQDFLRLNTVSLRLFSLIMSIYCLVLFLSSFYNSVSGLNRYIYMITLLICVSIIVSTFIKQVHTYVMITSLVYVFMMTSFSFGIALGLTQPEQISATFLVMLIAAPLMFYDRPFRMWILIVVFSIIFILLSLRYKMPDACETDVLNGIVFGTLSVVLNTQNLMVRTERVLYSRKMQIMAEVDVLTQLKNRNSFARNCVNYVKKARKNIVCIFADVNGLHELNDTKGHEAGDQMLKFIAEEIQNEFGKEDVYRIGGDEYVVMVCDRDENFAREKIDHIMERIEANNYHISVGIASESVNGIDMDQLIKKADERMYEAKALYYQQKGKERRKR